MANQYFTPGAVPVAQSRGSSSVVRAEYTSVAAGFDKLPTPAQVWGDAANYAADTGTANTYLVAVAASYVVSYFTGLTVSFKAATTNTGASTLNVNGLGAKGLVQPDGATALSAGAIVAGQMVEARYDGTSFQIVGSANVSWSNDPGAIQKQSYISFTTGGTSTAYTLTPAPGLAAYIDGASFWVNFHTTCGAAPTLAISGLASPPNLVRENPDGSYSNIAAAEIPSGHRSPVTLIGTTQALIETMPASRMYSSAATALSGTTFDISSIPSWVKRVSINISQLSFNGTANLFVQLGDSGGLETASYACSSGSGANAANWVTSSFTTGFGVLMGVAASTITGTMTLSLMDATNNVWILNGVFTTGAGTMVLTAGTKATSATMDRIRVWSTSGTDVFDNGSINYVFEG